MARPRSGSPVLVTIIGVACVASAVVGAIASGALERTDQVGYHALWSYRNAIKGAAVLFGLAGVSLVVSAARHSALDRTRVQIPYGVVIGLLLVAGGIAARVAPDALTHRVATWALIGGGGLALISLLRCFVAARPGGRAPFMVAGLFAIAGAATLVIAEVALEPTSAMALEYRPQWVRLPALGGLLVGLSLAFYIAFGQILGRSPSRILALLCGALLLASACYPLIAAGSLADGDVADMVYASERVSRATYWGALSLLGLGGALILAAITVAAVTGEWRGYMMTVMVGVAISIVSVVIGLVAGVLRYGVAVGAVWGVVLGFMSLRARGHAAVCVLFHLAVTALVACGLLLAGTLLIWTAPDLPMFIPPRAELDQQLLLAAVGLLAFAELTLMLAGIRYLFTFFTTVSIAGVAIGSMALVIVLSVMSGFENDLRQKILGHNAHMLITKRDGVFTEYQEISERVEAIKGVVATSPYLESELVIAANKNYSTVVIKGVDPRTVGKVTEIDENAQDAQALDRLWPLADDGGVLGPPVDAGVGDPDVVDAGVDGDAGEVVDPPPPDMNVDFSDPADFSGGELQKEGPDDSAADDAAGEPATDGDPPTDLGGVEGGLDPPPSDFDVELGDPDDFSGGNLPDAGPDDGDAGVLDWKVRAELDRTPDGFDPFDDELLEPMFEPIGADELLLPKSGELMRPRISPEIARLPGVLVGRELRKQIHLHTGQEVRIISPLYEDTPAGPVPRTRSLRVADVFYSGMYEYDFLYIYVALDVLQAFLDREGEVTGIEVRIENPENTGPVLSAMRKILPDDTYRVQDWQQINRSLFSALQLEKIAMFLVLAIIILVASFSIIGNLIMVVVEKAREIALLKTLGAANFGVMQIFISQGFFIGVVGTTIGVLHGLVACLLGATYGLPLNPEVYYIDRLPIHIEQGAVVAVGIAGMVISVVATIYPAYVGARLRPIEGLRYE